jgi:hypothetical protein
MKELVLLVTGDGRFVAQPRQAIDAVTIRRGAGFDELENIGGWETGED